MFVGYNAVGFSDVRENIAEKIAFSSFYLDFLSVYLFFSLCVSLGWSWLLKLHFEWNSTVTTHAVEQNTLTQLCALLSHSLFRSILPSHPNNEIN